MIVGKAIAVLKKERSHFLVIIVGRAIAVLKKRSHFNVMILGRAIPMTRKIDETALACRWDC